jgi:hypothetical protein
MSIPPLEKEARGRKAVDSAEKSKEFKSLEDKIKNIKPLRRNPKNYDDYFEGIITPERPSKKAKEEMKKGKTVWFT